MRPIGRVLHICQNRILVVQCDAASLPRLQSQVVDRRLRSVGVVVDVLGSVKKPYAAVFSSSPQVSLVGEQLFSR